jgi:uncharacterized protein YoxC
MMQTWQAILLVLFGVLVGAAVPALIQARRTLRRAERLLDDLGPRLGRTLDEVDRAAARFNRIGEEFEGGVRGLRGVADAVTALAPSLRQMQESVRAVAAIGAAVGPAVAAGLRAIFPFGRGGGEDAAGPGGEAARVPRGDGRGTEDFNARHKEVTPHE